VQPGLDTGDIQDHPGSISRSERDFRLADIGTETRSNMATKIFVNLPVKDLRKSVEFFTQLGFTFNPRFTDETATCMIVAEDIFVMLLTEEKFKTFTPKKICDATESTEVLVCLSCESRAKVDEMVRKAVAAGGTTYNELQDHGFMYGHGFQDLDGHIWELVFMDPGAVGEG
jgi:predicted lactoylglutathione lyase